MDQLTVDRLKSEAKDFCTQLTGRAIPELYGATDGKAVGTYVEHAFRDHLARQYDFELGSSASGIDFPSLNVDLKVTSIKQPQSSSPFLDATQKVYGLGYHLLVLVYKKEDDQSAEAARLDILHALFIDARRTSDYQTTTGILGILDRDGNNDDLTAFFEERNLPLDEIGRRQLADRVLNEAPNQGYLTVSNALQWRLQYGRAIGLAADGEAEGLQELLS
ncbi:MAG: restriction endonuclease [Acidimicrobiia bacterium]